MYLVIKHNCFYGEFCGMHCGVCMFSQHLCGFSPGTSASSTLQTHAWDELVILNWLLFVSMCPCSQFSGTTVCQLWNRYWIHWIVCELQHKMSLWLDDVLAPKKECRPTITKRTGFDFKVDTKHCTTGLYYCTVKHQRFCFMNSLGIYPEIWSIANLYSPVWGVILLKRKEQWGGESTSTLQFWPQSINRIKSSRCQEDFTSSDKQWDESSESSRARSTSFKVKKI